MAHEAPHRPRHSTTPPPVSRRLPGDRPPALRLPGPPLAPYHNPLTRLHHHQRPSPSQGRSWGWRLLTRRYHRSGRQPKLSVLLQPLDRHHLHVSGSDSRCASPSGSGTGSPDHTPLLQPTGPSTTTPWSPLAGGWDTNALVAAYNTMALASPSSDWVIDSGASYHTTPTTDMLSYSHPPPSSHPTSIVVGNGSTLPITSVGASVLPGPFYLNDVLVAPHITHNLLSVRRFTTDNSYSIEFDPSGFSVKDLATRTPLARCDSVGPLYTLRSSSTGVSSPPALVSTTTSTTWHRRLGHPGPDVMTKLSSTLASCNRGHCRPLSCLSAWPPYSSPFYYIFL
jgi:hypothetical protein